MQTHHNPPTVVAVLLNDAKAALPSDRLFAKACVARALDLLHDDAAPESPAKGGLAPWAARRCTELMRTRLAEGVSLDELAAVARLSVFHFARMFKQSVGVPPRLYLTRLRVERACELLETTELSVTMIAQEVGYSSNQVLARVFLKHQRMTPTDYRRAVSDPVGARATAASYPNRKTGTFTAASAPLDVQSLANIHSIDGDVPQHEGL